MNRLVVLLTCVGVAGLAADVARLPTGVASLATGAAGLAAGAAGSVVPGVAAQEGHPLTGTWSGDWGASATERTHVTLVMNWDGKNVTGTWNPGPDSVPLTSAFLDPTTWTVRLEVEPKVAGGTPARMTLEGRLEDLSSYHRKIVGTWTRGAERGDVRLTRD